MNLASDYQRRMASLVRAEAGRTGKVPTSFASIAMARRLARSLEQQQGGVDPVAASVPAPSPWLLRA